MLVPRYKLRSGELSQYVIDNIRETAEFTGWYDVKRSYAGGPHDPILLNESGFIFVPESGPLAGTNTQWPWLWCAIQGGVLIVADRKGGGTAPNLDEGALLRGWYDVDEAERMIWHQIGEDWNPEEIEEERLLLNTSYLLYKKVPQQPENIFLFGAGASYGSDRLHLHKTDGLPPIGKDLFERIRSDNRMKYWHGIPDEIVEVFRGENFEIGMEALSNANEEKQFALARDRELALFFTKYRPKPTNLYQRLGFTIANRLNAQAWSGAIVTLNYERLMEESLVNYKIYPAVKGVTYVDVFDAAPSPDRDLPPDNRLLEFCYPHGACHFYLYNGAFFDWKEGLIFDDEGGVAGNVGAIHFIWPPNLVTAFEKNFHPLFRRYQPSKRPAVSNYFLSEQIARTAEMLSGATTITIIGVQSTIRNDTHIWKPLAATKARILYVEPSEAGCSAFREWAHTCEKIEGRDFFISSNSFQNAFHEILRFSGLNLSANVAKKKGRRRRRKR